LASGAFHTRADTIAGSPLAWKVFFEARDRAAMNSPRYTAAPRERG